MLELICIVSTILLWKVGDILKESMWGYAIITLGILAVGIIWFFANATKTDQHNYNLLKVYICKDSYNNFKNVLLYS